MKEILGMIYEESVDTLLFPLKCVVLVLCGRQQHFVLCLLILQRPADVIQPTLEWGSSWDMNGLKNGFHTGPMWVVPVDIWVMNEHGPKTGVLGHLWGQPHKRTQLGQSTWDQYGTIGQSYETIPCGTSFFNPFISQTRPHLQVLCEVTFYSSKAQ